MTNSANLTDLVPVVGDGGAAGVKSMPVQAVNTSLRGPASGASAVPTMRLDTAADLVPAKYGSSAGLVNASLAVTPINSTVTVTSASPAVVSWTAHGLTAGTSVVFASTLTLPTGITSGTVYFVIAAGLTANAFEISATVGGSAINTSSTGSGTITCYAGVTVALKTYAGTDPTASDPVRGLFSATGTNVERLVIAALSLKLSAGSSYNGGAIGPALRLWVVLFDDGGTMRLGVVSCWQPFLAIMTCSVLREDVLTSSTAEGGIGGASTAGVIYTGTAVSAKAYKIVGYIEWSAVPVLGTIAAPNKIQMFGAGVALPDTVIQSVPAALTNVSTGTTLLPADDTIPQLNEGDQYLTCAILPTSPANVLRITCVVPVAHSVAGALFGAALFQDSIANALKGFIGFPGVANAAVPCVIVHTMLALTNNSTVTVTSATPAVVSWTAHGLTAGMAVIFRSSGTTPTGINDGQTYYVIAAGLTANAFEISATVGGSAINTSSTGTGTITCYALMTFKVRAGAHVAGTTTVCGIAGTRYWGGVVPATILIEEIQG